MLLDVFVLILRCREGDGAEDVLDTKLCVEYRRFGSGVLPAKNPWWLQNNHDHDVYLWCMWWINHRKLTCVISETLYLYVNASGKSMKTEADTYVLLKPSWGPDPTTDPPTKLDLSPECWEPWLKRTLLSCGGLSSLWAKKSSYCLFKDAETTWNRMSGRRMACLKMLWALEVKQTETGDGRQASQTGVSQQRAALTVNYAILKRDVCGSGCWCGYKLSWQLKHSGGHKEIIFWTLYTQILKIFGHELENRANESTRRLWTQSAPKETLPCDLNAQRRQKKNFIPPM